jgi:hypothetical protein
MRKLHIIIVVFLSSQCCCQAVWAIKLPGNLHTDHDPPGGKGFRGT